jgi:hypothetical protein
VIRNITFSDPRECEWREAHPKQVGKVFGVCQSAGVLAYWRTGVLEYCSTGVWIAPALLRSTWFGCLAQPGSRFASDRVSLALQVAFLQPPFLYLPQTIVDW